MKRKSVRRKSRSGSKKRSKSVRRKSRKRSKKRSKKDRRRSKQMNKYKPERGCSRQTNKKYSNRPGPPFPANLCRGSVKLGNDGKSYKSSRAYNRGRFYYKWKKI